MRKYILIILSFLLFACSHSVEQTAGIVQTQDSLKTKKQKDFAKQLFIDASILDLEGKDHEFGVIAGLGVLPRFQRKGLGTVIGMAAWNYFKKIGVKELRCEVYKFNTVSYTFITSLGFEEFGVKTYRREDFRIDDT